MGIPRSVRAVPSRVTGDDPASGNSTNEKMTNSTLVTICTYNEAENLKELVHEILEVAEDVDILIVDDGSPDGTGRIADEMASADERIRVVHRAAKMGLGTAIRSAALYSIEHGYQFMLNLDADFSHHPRHIPELREAMNVADVAIGSRYVAGGGVTGWGLLRHVLSRGVNLYARLLLGLQTRDNSGSFRCYRVSKLSLIDWTRVRAWGYAFQEELLYLCDRVGCRFVEVPIVFADRRYGESKINRGEVLHAIWIIARLFVDRVVGRSVSRCECFEDVEADGTEQPDCEHNLHCDSVDDETPVR